jgi:hypothetical protein
MEEKQLMKALLILSLSSFVQFRTDAQLLIV